MMVLRNKLSTFILAGLLFGGAFCLVSFVFQKGSHFSIPRVLLYGIIYAVFVYFFAKRIEKKSENLRKQIETKRKIICQGPASYRKTPINAIGGWMFLSEDAIEFYCHSQNFNGTNAAILLDDITSVSAKGNALKVETKEKTYSFLASQAKVWKEQIDQTVAS